MSTDISKPMQQLGSYFSSSEKEIIFLSPEIIMSYKNMGLSWQLSLKVNKSISWDPERFGSLPWLFPSHLCTPATLRPHTTLAYHFQILNQPSYLPFTGDQEWFLSGMTFSSSNSRDKTLLFLFACRTDSQVRLIDSPRPQARIA